MAQTRTIKNELHQIVVLKVTGRYEDGRLKDCMMIHEDQSVEVHDGVEFVTAWIPVKVLKKGS